MNLARKVPGLRDSRAGDPRPLPQAAPANPAGVCGRCGALLGGDRGSGIATARTPAGERLVRLGDLKERLFAPALPALLNKSKRWWVRENSGAGDYRNIAGAIIREAQALAAEAQGGAEAENLVAAVSPGKMRRMRYSGPTPRPMGRG